MIGGRGMKDKLEDRKLKPRGCLANNSTCPHLKNNVCQFRNPRSLMHLPTHCPFGVRYIKGAK
jgi:hypothetical protein